MSRIMIFGGHGKIALLTAPLLVNRGDEVTSVFRNPEHTAEVAETGATPLVADLEQLSTQQVAEHLDGCDAVIWSAGAGGGDPERTLAVDRDAAIRAMEAAVTAGARRFIMVSYFGASEHHGIDPEHSFYAYAEAKGKADQFLRSTTLDWTVLGPSTLTLEPATGCIDVSAETSTTASRGNVAHVIAAALADNDTIHRTIRFNDGDTEIVQALSA